MLALGEHYDGGPRRGLLEPVGYAIARWYERGEHRDHAEPGGRFAVRQAATMVLPQVVRDAFGADPRDAEFRDRFLSQLQRLFQADGASGNDGGAA
jgi:hypothetical protein